MTAIDDAFHANRRRLFGLAYRMLGSAMDAEDIVQETWLRARDADAEALAAPQAFLVTIATRLCLDQLRSARARRESYVGAWLPEPIPDANAISPDAAVELADDLSFALLMALEKLSPEERAAFLLHDVFGVPFAQVAETLAHTEVSCRQLAARARKAIERDAPRRKATPEEHAALLMKFAEAVSLGDPSKIAALFAPEAVAYSDGGGVRTAALNPIRGADRIARFLVGIETKSMEMRPRMTVTLADINGAPGFLLYYDGVLDQTITIEADGGKISALYMVRNPAKLGAFLNAGA